MPRVRQVVHRGFVNDQHENASSDRLVFTTDVRSSKAMDIASCSNAPVELAWYIAPERVQVRTIQRETRCGTGDLSALTSTVSDPRGCLFIAGAGT